MFVRRFRRFAVLRSITVSSSSLRRGALSRLSACGIPHPLKLPGCKECIEGCNRNSPPTSLLDLAGERRSIQLAPLGHSIPVDARDLRGCWRRNPRISLTRYRFRANFGLNNVHVVSPQGSSLKEASTFAASGLLPFLALVNQYRYVRWWVTKVTLSISRRKIPQAFQIVDIALSPGRNSPRQRLHRRGKHHCGFFGSKSFPPSALVWRCW